jgi:hypothetical protein
LHLAISVASFWEDRILQKETRNDPRDSTNISWLFLFDLSRRFSCRIDRDNAVAGDFPRAAGGCFCHGEYERETRGLLDTATPHPGCQAILALRSSVDQGTVSNKEGSRYLPPPSSSYIFFLSLSFRKTLHQSPTPRVVSQ